jgi:class 3 adenylate cyclase
LAEGGEILASSLTVAHAALAFAVSDGREVRLKGISTPVEIVSVDWRASGAP